MIIDPAEHGERPTFASKPKSAKKKRRHAESANTATPSGTTSALSQPVKTASLLPSLQLPSPAEKKNVFIQQRTTRGRAVRRPRRVNCPTRLRIRSQACSRRLSVQRTELPNSREACRMQKLRRISNSAVCSSSSGIIKGQQDVFAVLHQAQVR